MTALRRLAAAAGVVAAIVLAVVIVTGAGGGVAAAVPALILAGSIAVRWPTRTEARGRAVLLLLLLPTLVHFHASGGRISGDGVSYYVYVRSLAMDRDLDFTNEYTHYGLIAREDIAVPRAPGCGARSSPWDRRWCGSRSSPRARRWPAWRRFSARPSTCPGTGRIT